MGMAPAKARPAMVEKPTKNTADALPAEEPLLKRRRTEPTPADAPPPAKHTPSGGGIISYRGFTEHAYRLVFDFEDKYQTTPHVCTVLPDGTIENEKDLEPKKDKGLIAYAYPQTTTADVARNHPNSPFVWKRADASYAVVQTWPTNYNDKFRADYVCSTKNPDPKVFIPQAAEELKKTMVELFGPQATYHDILYCHKTTTNPKTVYIGTAAELQCFLRETPQVVREMDIIELTEHGFVCRTINGKKEEGKKDFKFGDHDTRYALYTKQGWDEMACITPWHQFEKDREMGERIGVCSRIVELKNDF